MLALLEKRTDPPLVRRENGDRLLIVGKWVRRLIPGHSDLKEKIAAMDRSGIDLTALSINDPGPELFGDDSPAIARLLNDFIADAVNRYPTRLFGLATLPYDSENAMLREFERAVGTLGMKGILLYSNIAGRFPDEPQFRQLFAEAERRGVPLLLHPACPSTFEATQGYDGAGGLGLMFDTTIALHRLILSGVFEEFPNLKLVCPHVGGALPYLIGRIDHQVTVLKRGAARILRKPSEYLKQVWLDTVSPIPLAIRYGIDFAGAGRMLYASDHPWVDPLLIAGHIDSLQLNQEEQRQIYSGNACSLFNL